MPDDERPPENEYSLSDVVARARDIVLYAPIALVLDAPELLPQLAEKGKVHMRNARAMGPHALRKLQDRLMGLVPSPVAEAPPAAARRPAAAPRATIDVEQNGEHPVAPPSPPVDDLAIPDYDSLSALQVVDRLPGLTAAELEAVRAYEAAHRGRKTILNKAAQLQA
jgi:hypothetical protein